MSETLEGITREHDFVVFDSSVAYAKNIELRDYIYKTITKHKNIVTVPDVINEINGMTNGRNKYNNRLAKELATREQYLSLLWPEHNMIFDYLLPRATENEIVDSTKEYEHADVHLAARTFVLAKRAKKTALITWDKKLSDFIKFIESRSRIQKTPHFLRNLHAIGIYCFDQVKRQYQAHA